MKLDERDVEAVAKSRVSREANNKTNLWMLASVIAIMGGVFIVNLSRLMGWVVSVAGFIAFIWYVNSLNKRQAEYNRQLQAEWRLEQRVGEPKTEEAK